jgi:uridine kinase
MSKRHELLQTVARQILALPTSFVLRVAIDGVDGAGKTVFGDELAAVLRAAGRSIIRASVDGFHNPRAVRYARGRHSPIGYFHDSYNYDLLKAALLDPLSPGGSGRYRAAAFDHRTDAAVILPEAIATPGSILVFDGIFVHRPELRSYWDFSIFLDVQFDHSYRRMAERDGGPPDPHASENRRYLEGQRLYLQESDPQRHASIVIDNNDLHAPFLVPPNAARPAKPDRHKLRQKPFATG